jgi:hypothetical protein
VFYHHRELRYVAHGKVGPPPVEALDVSFVRAYQWLGQYCGFFPQIWLSRSRSRITGFRTQNLRRGAPSNGLLFGFEAIQGFPLAYDLWCELLIPLANSPNLEAANRAIREHFESRASDPDLLGEPVSRRWRETRDVREVLSKHLFVKRDQVVVPKLNLKAAKLVICQNERQKTQLRRMGFIEDRLVIRPPRG